MPKTFAGIFVTANRPKDYEPYPPSKKVSTTKTEENIAPASLKEKITKITEKITSSDSESKSESKSESESESEIEIEIKIDSGLDKILNKIKRNRGAIESKKRELAQLHQDLYLLKKKAAKLEKTVLIIETKWNAIKKAIGPLG
ncbi:MAG: hypothetical protein M1829_005164 [Trizodia sp. TS-e1964]|nr:MAG: hypothetical protein M1829_005164 [Trizodia sp. TS-e1964]